MHTKQKTLSIVIPIYNEEENISELYRRLTASLQKDFFSFRWEILFVDDGSDDKSVSMLRTLQKKDPAIKILQLSRNFGHHIALTAGLDYAGGDLVVTMDGDLQDQPEEMIKLFNKLQEGYDVIFGDRQNKRFSFFKRLCSKVFFKLLGLLVAEKIIINAHVFRIITKQVVAEIRKLRETNRYILGLMSWTGFKQASVPVQHGDRFKGKTKYTFRQRLSLAITAIFAFSDYLLKFITRLGFCIVVFSFLFAGYIFSKKLLYGIPVMGWSSLITSIFFIGGVQIFLLGILGEYIGRIYMETKNRPLYVVRDFIAEKSMVFLDDLGRYEKKDIFDRGSRFYR